jgi:hypothetical protein
MPVLNQFSQIQQQMFEQFHQNMVMLVQMFSAMHQDQMGLIREELDRLNQLTQELHTLQAEASKQAVAPLPPLAEPKRAPLAQENGAKAAAPSKPAPAPAPAATAPAKAPAAPAARPPAEKRPTAPVPPASPAEAHRSEAPPSQPTTGDIHTWLSDRIAALQQERQSRWQKILGFLMGKGSEQQPKL